MLLSFMECNIYSLVMIANIDQLQHTTEKGNVISNINLFWREKVLVGNRPIKAFIIVNIIISQAL